MAQEITTYSYDELGRLVASTRSGGPNNGVAMGTCFDAAGNRTVYAVNTGGSASCAGSTPTPTPTPTPTATPTPTPTNLPPVTVADSAAISCWEAAQVNLTANDSDPENNVPLALLSITRISGEADATIVSASSVNVNANGKGSSTFTYTVADSLGASSTGQLSILSTGSVNYCSGGGGGPLP